jgi:hypothetical protein
MVKAAFYERKALSASELDLNLRKKLVKCCICDAKSQKLRNVYQTYLESFRSWCWRRTEISWFDRVGNKVLSRVQEEKKVLHIIKRRKAN